MKRFSRKNINAVMADVRHPGSGPQKEKKKKSSRKGPIVVWILVVALLVMVVLVLDIGSNANSIYGRFKRLVDGVRGFDTSIDYLGSLDGIETELGNLDQKARLLAAVSKLKQIPEIIAGLRDVVATVRALGENFTELSGDGFSLAFGGGGERLIGLLSSMRDNLDRLNEISVDLRAKAAEFGVEGENVDFATAELVQAHDGLNALIGFLDTEEPRRIALLFLNPSELRPNGGFAGSYGELVLQRGSVESLEVNDIYYPDKFLPLKVIPPIQLQSITPNWGARDTGWFFDFSTSAENLTEYLEASTIYEEDVNFDGVIALNVKVIEDLLRLTGPIEVPEYNLSLDHENFLRELQQEVQDSRAPGENPKRVLQFAAPRLIEALGSLEGGSKGKLIEVFVSRARNKDIQMYFEDEGLAKLIDNLGVGGHPYEIEQGFVGDYLALVNTNIAGGKTDIFVDQYATLKSAVELDGQIYNDLTVTRYHKGNNESESWYNHLNQNFFKIFTHPDSVLTYIEGGERKNLRPLVSYTPSTYKADSDLAEVESTRTILQVASDQYAEQYLEAGKKVFATWFNLEPGERRSLKLRWLGSKIPVKDNQGFTFVLDKQAGSEMEFDYVIVAPEGYYWSESGNDLFRYRVDNLSLRVEIELLLKQKR